jgi:hypothetical protein
MASFGMLWFITVILWQLYIVAGWNIQESINKLLETLENSEEYDIVFPLVMNPDTNKLVPRVKRNLQNSEFQTEHATQPRRYGTGGPLTFDGGDDVDAPVDNDISNTNTKDMMANVKSAIRSKAYGNKAQASSNNNHDTYKTLENTNVLEEGGEITNRSVENMLNDERKTAYFHENIEEESIDMEANGNIPEDVTVISLKDWILEVKRNPLLLIQEGLDAEWVSEGQKVSEESHGGCKLQTGFVRGDVNSIVAVTTCDTSPIDGSGTGDMIGLIQVNGDSYFIQPLVPTGGLNRQHPHLVYRAKTTLELGDDQDFGIEWKPSESDSSQRSVTVARNDSCEAGTVIPNYLRRSKRESYWRNMTELKFFDMTGGKEFSSTEERPDLHLVEQTEEDPVNTRAIIEHIRKKLEREDEVGYFLGNDMETEGKTTQTNITLLKTFLLVTEPADSKPSSHNERHINPSSARPMQLISSN